MKYLKISSKGIIEPQALCLIGASTKRNNDDLIGQFGSGNKYALAYFMRNNYEVYVYSGTQEIPIEKHNEQFRNQHFDVLYINGERTSITSDMGHKWQAWQALRELYCNAIDEGESKLELVDKIMPSEDETHFYISVDDNVEDFVENFDKYFSERKQVLSESYEGRILEKTGSAANIYRKGVRCFDTKKKSAFDYDFNNIRINESRVIRCSWHIQEKLWKMVFKCEDRETVLKILRSSGSKDNIEYPDSIAHIDTSNISKAFINIIQSINIAPVEYGGLIDDDEKQKYIFIPAKIFNALRDYIDDEQVDKGMRISRDTVYKPIDKKPLHRQTIKQAREFLDECDFEIPYDIEVARFNEKQILGSARGEVILLSERCVEKGVNEVVNTMIEEYVHIKHGCEDKTRAMQTAIIDEFITYMKNQNAYAI